MRFFNEKETKQNKNDEALISFSRRLPTTQMKSIFSETHASVGKMMFVTKRDYVSIQYNNHKRPNAVTDNAALIKLRRCER